MTCKNCLHYEACKGTYYTAKGCDNIALYDFDGEMYADSGCEDFTARSEWVHLPFDCKDTPNMKYGRWEQCFEDFRKQIEGDKCSACGFEHYGSSVRHYHYCPNCGARMVYDAETEKALEGMK